MFTAIYGVSPWQMPPEAALGLMENLSMANSWKASSTVTAISAAIGGSNAAENFRASLFGSTPDSRAQRRAEIDELKRSVGR